MQAFLTGVFAVEGKKFYEIKLCEGKEEQHAFWKKGGTNMKKEMMEKNDMALIHVEHVGTTEIKNVQENETPKAEKQENKKLNSIEQKEVKPTNVDSEEEKQRRDQKFTNLFLKYKSLMFWTANDVLNDEYLAEDAVQEAFLKLLRHIDQIGPVHSAEARRYVSAAARTVAIDRYRKRTSGTSKEMFAEDVDYLHEIEAEPCLEDSEGNRILDILFALPDTYREVCLSKYVEKLENWEIAERLKLREGTVRQKLSRGKALIEQAIRQLEKEEDERIL